MNYMDIICCMHISIFDLISDWSWYWEKAQNVSYLTAVLCRVLISLKLKCSFLCVNDMACAHTWLHYASWFRLLVGKLRNNPFLNRLGATFCSLLFIKVCEQPFMLMSTFWRYIFVCWGVASLSFIHATVCTTSLSATRQLQNWWCLNKIFITLKITVFIVVFYY